MDFVKAMAVFPTFRYGEVLLFRDEAEILYNTVKKINAKNVLELGVGNATSTIALLASLEETGGKLTSVDIIDNPWYDRNSPNKVKSLGLEKNWNFITGDDLEYAKTCQDRYDIVFLDTDHTYRQTLNELNAFTPFLNTKGCMILHDTLHPDHSIDVNLAVLKFIREEKEKNKYWGYILYPTTCGMGLMERIQ